MPCSCRTEWVPISRDLFSQLIAAESAKRASACGPTPREKFEHRAAQKRIAKRRAKKGYR